VNLKQEGAARAGGGEPPGGSAGGEARIAGAGTTRRRGPALEDAILDAAWEVLIESGYRGFTYEAVAARAGTSRPVLYRRWPQRDDLLLATVARFWWSQPITVPDTGRLREDAIGLLRHANAGRARMMALVSVQLMDYFRDTGTTLAELRETLRPPGQPPVFETIVARAVERGELAARPRSARLLNLPLDLLRHDTLMMMDAVPDAAIVEMVDEIWLPLLRAGRP
jgi:AcrR family transcriptional regulator